MVNDTFRSRYVLIAVCFMATVVFFWQLGTPALENWDEGIHAEVTRETVANNAWISLSYRDAYYTAKPPLKFWLTAPLFIVFGPSEFTTRFWSALAGVATALLLTIWAWQWRKKAWFAALTGFVFLAFRANFYHAFRTGETDGLMVFFTLLALWAYWRTAKNPKQWYTAGIAIGLAFLTKPIGGILPMLIIGLDIIAGWRCRTLPWKFIGRAVGLAALVIMPWHLAETLRHGATFWNSFIGFHVIDRAEQVLYKNVVPWWWYGKIIQLRTFPFSPFIVLGLFFGLWRWIAQRDALDRLLIIWSVTVFVMFTLVQTKFDWYILPLYPALALLGARMIDHVLHSDTRITRYAALAAFAWAVYLIPSGLVQNGTLWWLTPYVFLPMVTHTFIVQRLCVALVSASVVVAVYFLLRKFKPQQAFTMTIVLVCASVFLVALGWQVSYFRHLEKPASLKPIATYAAARAITRIDAVDADLLHQPSLYFYLRRIPGMDLRELPISGTVTARYVLTRTSVLPSLTDQCCAILTAGQYVLLDRTNR